MKKQITLALILGMAGYSASAQQARKVIPGNAGMYPASVEFSPGAEPDFIRGSVLLTKDNAFARTNEAILRHSEADQIGEEHFRYQQTINSIPVEGATYVVHVKDGKIKRQNGEWISEQPDGVSAARAVNAQTALDVAMKAFGAKSYKWQLPAEEEFIKKESGDANATFLPKAELVYYSGENEVAAEKLRLAYKLDLYAQEPIGRRMYFIDAQTGAVLALREVLHTRQCDRYSHNGLQRHPEHRHRQLHRRLSPAGNHPRLRHPDL